ncbi:hypothetical protein [Elizabethkingia bruuniana]|uniref:hypothetical protein n=1 Tax=Elizabethkingia bruuniana TaxID=1756149 RepID=UPI00398C4363
MKFNIQKGSGNPGLPTAKKGQAILALKNDILQVPELSADGVAYEGNFVFVPGATFGLLYMTPSTQAATYEAGGNPDGMGSKNKFVGEHPGTTREIMAWMKKYGSEEFIIIYGGCCTNTSEKKVMGSICNPMKLSASGKDDKDGNANTLTFEQEQLNDERVMFYYGDIDFALPYSPAGPSFALDKTKGLQYQLPASTAAANISVTSSDYENGSIITFLGGGGTTPLLMKNSSAGAVGVLLKNGADWTALQGASIHFRVVVADKTYLVELSRK